MENLKPHIAICDDEEDILDLCSIILQPEYHITAIQQCGIILPEIERVRPDLILMDLWLCGYRGEDLIEELRLNAELRNIPVILFSAKDNLASISNKLHVEGYLCKPFTGKELLSVIHQVFDKTGKQPG